MSHSKDYGLDLVQTANAFSPDSVKQLASAIIWEETRALIINIQKCEAQLLALRRNFAFWKAHQNRLSDISKLPEDVLINIWLYCAENSGEDLWSLKGWLAITHVCSHWRKLAVGAQGLWRWPCIRHPTLAVPLLNRAGNTPLTLLVDFDEIPMKSEEAALESFALAGRLLQRTESLQLRARGGAFGAFSGSFFSSLKEGGFKAIQNLKSLSIDHGYCLPTLRARQELDLTGLIRAVPGLRDIWLQNMNILTSPSWMTPLPQLTHLEIIINSTDPDDGLPTWGIEEQQSPLHKVLSSIIMLPNIRHLLLVEVFEPLTAEDLEWLKANPNPIALSSLQVLWLGSNIEITQHFLNHVVYPQATEVRIEIPLKGPQLEALESLLAISADIKRIGGPIRSLELSRESDNWGMVTNYIGFSTRPMFINPTFDVLLSQDKSDPFPNLPRICSFDHLEQINCELPTDSFNTELWKAFGSLPKLRRVFGFDVDDDPAFLKVLASFRPSGESIFHPFTAPVAEDPATEVVESTTPRLYFPNLTHTPTAGSISAQEYLRRIMIVRNTWNVHSRF